MSLENYAKLHITKRGGIKTPYFETEPTRVTTHSRIHNAATRNIEFLEKEMDMNATKIIYKNQGLMEAKK